MPSGKYGGPFLLLLLLTSSFSAAYAQASSLACALSAASPLLHAEGVSEKLGDILLQCSGGTAGTVVSGNLTVFLPVGITNRVTPDGVAPEVALSYETAAGAAAAAVSGRVNNQSITFNGLSFTIPAAGAVSLRIANLRGNVSQLAADSTVQAFLSTNLAPVVNAASPLTVGRVARSLFSVQASTGVPCGPAALPDSITLSSLLSSTAFASTRVTEGFAAAFRPKDAGSDTGTRILVSYSNVPTGARLFVPDAVAGSTATEPTAGGDLGLQQSGGQYTSGSGTLLLARVEGADATGAGGTPVYTPGTGGPGAVSFNSASELPVADGTAYAVYEVMDADPLVNENAQFPTLAVAASVNVKEIVGETVTLAPLSDDNSASVTAPVPRFLPVAPGTDCGLLGDCNAAYFPQMVVWSKPLDFTANAGAGINESPGYITVNNPAGGLLSWTATVIYKNGSGWLRLDPASDISNHRSIQAYVSPQQLAPGTYQATITIDAGPVSGAQSLPVTLTVKPSQAAPPAPTITSITNAADFSLAPLAPGSLATIWGSHLGGKDVTVTFDGVAARLLYASDTQINVLVPSTLAKMSVPVVVTVDGASATLPVAMLPVAPAIFNPGVLNQDNSVNSAAHPAAPGSVIQIFGTGLPSASHGVTVKIHDRDNLVPIYAGLAPGIEGVQQVNVAIPADLPAMRTNLFVCALSPDGTQTCSQPAVLVLWR